MRLVRDGCALDHRRGVTQLVHDLAVELHRLELRVNRTVPRDHGGYALREGAPHGLAIDGVKQIRQDLAPVLNLVRGAHP